MLKPLVFLCCLGVFALPAHAIVTCTKADATASSVSSNATADAPAVARLLAGVTSLEGAAGDTPAGEYVKAANEGWQAYVNTFAQPLRAWVAKEVRLDNAPSAFYPFSGPDLPSVLAIYPAASHHVLISDQYATRYFDPFSLKESEQGRILNELGESWARFGRLGFFLTQELNKGGGHKYHLSPTMILMAFAVRLGYEVRAVSPTCLDTADLSIRPLDAKDARWGSVRLVLRKDGRDTVVDYVQMDLSNRGLRKPGQRALVESLAKSPVLLKAASHLPQQSGFSILRNAVLASAPLVVQDETGLEYDEMAKKFNVRLYGEYVEAHHLFKEATNASLIKAYRNRAKEVRPLNFQLGYEKAAGSAIQVATRQ
jgi:hypothetical protein